MTPQEDRQRRVQALLRFREHYRQHDAAPKFLSRDDWAAWVQWVREGEAWLVGAPMARAVYSYGKV